MGNVIEKGICRLNVVPVRKEPSDKSELVTQLLFGEHYEVIETSDDREWIMMRNALDDYVGWIDGKQFSALDTSMSKYSPPKSYTITTDICAKLILDDQEHYLVAGSILSSLSGQEGGYQFSGATTKNNIQQRGAYLEEISKKFLDIPYLWGGRTPFGIDCSGFTQLVFRIGGYFLKRDAWQQENQGIPIESNEEIKPGDLAFFAKPGGDVSHVGIILGNSKIIHASGRVRIDKLDIRGIFNDELGKYTHDLFSIKRIIDHE